MADFIRDIFEANRVIIFFVYGQVFFVLGLAIALQSWRHSRLTLARHLKWLAAFGFTHGFHEWGDVFIPIQTGYLARPIINLLFGLQLILLAVSFACLFQFGVETLRPLPPRLRLVRYIPGMLLVIWIFVAFGPTTTALPTVEAWYHFNNVWARYSLGFPGALLAAYGLRRQAQELIAPLKLPQIWQTLQAAGLALAGYSVLGGLAVPHTDFFPANWFNAGVVEQWTLIPVQVYRSGLGLILALAFIRALEVFRVELDRRLDQMEESQVLITERERIGRELHDGTLQTIYAAGLLLKTSAKELARDDCPDKGVGRVQQAIGLLDEAVADIRRYIGTLRAQPSTRSLAAGLRELAEANHLRSLIEVEVELDLPQAQPLSPAQVGHLLAIINEALSNVVRHAQASRVWISASMAAERLVLSIKDNGQGLPPDYITGYGLRNMRDRARLLGGKMSIETQPERGTTVRVEVPWSEMDEKTKVTTR